VVVGAGPMASKRKAQPVRSLLQLAPEMLSQLDRQGAHHYVEMGKEVLAQFKRTSATQTGSLRIAGLKLRPRRSCGEVGPHFVKLNPAKKSIPHSNLGRGGLGGSQATRSHTCSGCRRVVGGASKLNPDLKRTGPHGRSLSWVIWAKWRRKQLLPQLGSVDMQSGEHVGRQIAADRRSETQAFQYWDKGFMATIGRAKPLSSFHQRTLHGRSSISPGLAFIWRCDGTRIGSRRYGIGAGLALTQTCRSHIIENE